MCHESSWVDHGHQLLNYWPVSFLHPNPLRPTACRNCAAVSCVVTRFVRSAVTPPPSNLSDWRRRASGKYSVQIATGSDKFYGSGVASWMLSVKDSRLQVCTVVNGLRSLVETDAPVTTNQWAGCNEWRRRNQHLHQEEGKWTPGVLPLCLVQLLLWLFWMSLCEEGWRWRHQRQCDDSQGHRSETLQRSEQEMSDNGLAVILSGRWCLGGLDAGGMAWYFFSGNPTVTPSGGRWGSGAPRLRAGIRIVWLPAGCSRKNGGAYPNWAAESLAFLSLQIDWEKVTQLFPLSLTRGSLHHQFPVGDPEICWHIFEQDWILLPCCGWLQVPRKRRFEPWSVHIVFQFPCLQGLVGAWLARKPWSTIPPLRLNNFCWSIVDWPWTGPVDPRDWLQEKCVNGGKKGLWIYLLVLLLLCFSKRWCSCYPHVCWHPLFCCLCRHCSSRSQCAGTCYQHISISEAG